MPEIKTIQNLSELPRDTTWWSIPRDKVNQYPGTVYAYTGPTKIGGQEWTLFFVARAEALKESSNA